jgi:hypothetical protein
MQTFLRIHEADLAGDGYGGAQMIAGDHLDAYPGCPAARYRLDGFLSRRVYHALQANEAKPPGDFCMFKRFLADRSLAPGKGQDTQALCCHVFDLVMNGLDIQRNSLHVLIEGGIAADQNALQRSFQIDVVGIGRLIVMQGSHELMGRLKRDGIQTRVRFRDVRRVQPFAVTTI